MSKKYTVDDLGEMLEKGIAKLDEASKPVPHGVPHVTTGPIGQDSRGFSLCKALWAARTGKWEQAKPEQEACERYQKALVAANELPQNTEPDGFHIPLGHEFASARVKETDDYRYFKSMWSAHPAEVDVDEVMWNARRGSATVKKSAMSYLQDLIGGTLVAPPVQGELIELIRPKEALLNAGCTSVPLPPNGKITFPRQTGPTTFYWLQENTEVTESNPTTGQISMMAHKGGVLVTVPNELLKFASVSAEGMIRNDVSKSIALGIDYAGLYGTGGGTQPKGLVRYTGTNEVIDYAATTPAPAGVATNGNRIRPEDAYNMVGLIEDRNFEFSGWIFRPRLANSFQGYRADAVTIDDKAGAFVASMMRAMADRMPGENWGGYKVTKSAVVRNNQVKGSSGSTLTEVFGGQWEHLMLGMFGAVEFAASNQAGNTFAKDQTQIRALVYVDSAPRYEGAFCWYKQLLPTV